MALVDLIDFYKSHKKTVPMSLSPDSAGFSFPIRFHKVCQEKFDGKQKFGPAPGAGFPEDLALSQIRTLGWDDM